MKEGYTHITIILDRSGSMQTIRDDVIGGYNAFLTTQQEAPGHATLTLVQFDTQDAYEVVYQMAPITDVAKLTSETFVPRAGTPLYDCLGRGINDLGKQLAALPEAERPEKVVFVVITDGRENSSQEFSKRVVTDMIDVQQNTYNWQFVFLSADLDAADDAVDLGVRRSHTLAFDNTGAGTQAAFAALARNVAGLRSAKSPSPDDLAFTDEDRAAQGNESKRGPRTA